MYDQYHQSSVSDQYDMRHHEDRMYAERAGPGLQQHHSSPNMSQSPGGPGHHRTSSGPPPGSQYGAPLANGYGNGNGVPPPQPPSSQYNGASYQQQQVQIPRKLFIKNKEPNS